MAITHIWKDTKPIESFEKWEWSYNVRLFPIHQTGKLKKSDSMTSGSDVGKMILHDLAVGEKSLNAFLDSYMKTY